MKFWISAVRFHRRWGWQQRRAFGWRLAVTLSLIYPGVSYCSRLPQWFLSKQAISFLIPPQPQPHPRQEERRRIPTKAMLSTAASWRNEAKENGIMLSPDYLSCGLISSCAQCLAWASQLFYYWRLSSGTQKVGFNKQVNRSGSESFRVPIIIIAR